MPHRFEHLVWYLDGAIFEKDETIIIVRDDDYTKIELIKISSFFESINVSYKVEKNKIKINQYNESKDYKDGWCCNIG